MDEIKPSQSQRIRQLEHHVERLELVLKWTVERYAGMASVGGVSCSTCGHDITDHLDDADGGDACIFPMTFGAPLSLCRCLGFRSAPQQDDHQDDQQDEKDEPPADVDAVSE